MAEASGERAVRSEVPTTWGSRLKLIGPGLIVAATGVGAGDMVTSLAAGTQYGTVLVWTIIMGAILKFTLTEGLGRWYMATAARRSGSAANRSKPHATWCCQPY